MKVAVVGAGAMGSLYAGLFAHAGHEVLAITRNQAHCAAINSAGLNIDGASGKKNIRMRGAAEPAGFMADLIIVAVKAADVMQAGRIAQSMCTDNSLVMAMQNGLGSAEQLAECVGAQRLVVAIAGGFGACIQEPGFVFHSGMQKIQMAAFEEIDNTRLNKLVEQWREAGFNAALSDDIARMQWEKLICNSAFSALCTITGLTVGEVRNDAALWALALSAAQEAADVAKARGIAVTFNNVEEHVAKFAAQVMSAKPSMLQDYQAQRKGEIDVINGAIPRYAAPINVSVPVNTTLSALVRQLEKHF